MNRLSYVHCQSFPVLCKLILFDACEFHHPILLSVIHGYALLSLGIHSIQTVHWLSSLLLTWPAHFHFFFLMSIIMSATPVCSLAWLSSYSFR